MDVEEKKTKKKKSKQKVKGSAQAWGNVPVAVIAPTSKKKKQGKRNRPKTLKRVKSTTTRQWACPPPRRSIVASCRPAVRNTSRVPDSSPGGAG